jgi:hypothetical protein
MAGDKHIHWEERGTPEDRYWVSPDVNYRIYLEGYKYSITIGESQEFASLITKLSSAKKIVWLMCHG